MIKRLLLCLFLLVPVTAQAEITQDSPPGWIVNCWEATDSKQKILVTFKHYDDSSPSFIAENWIRIFDGKQSVWTWVFSFGPNLVCKMEKVLE